MELIHEKSGHSESLAKIKTVTTILLKAESKRQKAIRFEAYLPCAIEVDKSS
jgi:hypothetical protein